jgi:hypothetical protein
MIDEFEDVFLIAMGDFFIDYFGIGYVGFLCFLAGFECG